MIELVDIREIRDESRDIADLNALLLQLVGQPFRRFQVSYGEELRLHLGALRDVASPRLKGRTRGSFVLAARASSWIVSSGSHRKLAASEDASVAAVKPDSGAKTKQVEIKTIETLDLISPSSIVLAATSARTPDGFSLRLEFSDGSMVLIVPSSDLDKRIDGEPDDVEEKEISDWEMLTPHERILKAGPGELWKYVDSGARFTG